MSNEMIIIAIVSIPVLYVLVRVGASAWFSAKLNYHKTVISQLDQEENRCEKH